ncbi:MAG: AMP-binding protein [Promethearchaeota archaeon]
MKWTKVPKVEQPWMKYWPKETPRNLDYEEIPLDESLRRVAKDIPNSIALHFGGWEMTYAELDEKVDQFATGLRVLGVKEGSVVAIMTPNLPQYVIAFYGILRAGGIANPIIPLNKYAEIVYQCNDSKADVLIILDFLYDENLTGKDMSKFESLKTIILCAVGNVVSPIKRVLGNLLGKIPRMKVWPEGKVGGIRYRKFEDIYTIGTPISLPELKVDPVNDVVCLIYTGGTTGTPKGVQLTHLNLVANCQQAHSWITTQLPDVAKQYGTGGMIVVLPLSHSFALTICMSVGLWLGYKLILFATPPDPISGILKSVSDLGATFAPGVPTLWNKVTQDPGSKKYKGKMDNFVACLSAAAPLPWEVKVKFEELTGALIIEGYGMSEAAPMLTASPFHRSVKNTVGFPVPDAYLKIMDSETGKILLPQYKGTFEEFEALEPEEQEKYIGEICGSGPQIMKGYLNKPEDTKYALRTDADGIVWYYTADIGMIDAEGYLRILDRKRDMIKYKGHSVFPREVEDLMYTHPAVLEVGVYGLKSDDPEVGEIIKAAVALKPEFIGKVTEKDLIDWCKENIAWFKYPREIAIVKELPKSLVGKVLRRVLRDADEEKQ